MPKLKQGWMHKVKVGNKGKKLEEDKMSEQYKQMMEDLYKYPETYWDLTDERQEIALKEMQKMFDSLVDACEQSINNTKQLLIALSGYANMLHKIVES